MLTTHLANGQAHRATQLYNTRVQRRKCSCTTKRIISLLQYNSLIFVLNYNILHLRMKAKRSKPAFILLWNTADTRLLLGHLKLYRYILMTQIKK